MFENLSQRVTSDHPEEPGTNLPGRMCENPPQTVCKPVGSYLINGRKTVTKAKGGS